MIIAFTVKNHLSIRNEVTLDFWAKGIKELKDSNVIETRFNNIGLLKSIGIFGLNNSGKSNLFKSLYVLKSFIIESSIKGQANHPISVTPFRLVESCKFQPTEFTISFLIESYRYDYSVKLTSKEVVYESLTYSKKKKPIPIFERKFQDFTFGKSFGEAEFFRGFTRPNASFISVLAQFNNSIGKRIVSWFQDMIFISDNANPKYMARTAELLQDKIHGPLIKEILKISNLGFEEIILSQPTDNLFERDEFNHINYLNHNPLNTIRNAKIRAKHDTYDERGNFIGHEYFDIVNESSGTQRFIGIIGRFVHTIVNGGVIIIDEIDSRLHSFLSELIIKLANDVRSNKSQLIFISHNSDLLDDQILRRDQILIARKDDVGSTYIQSFHDLGVRIDLNFKKYFLQGELIAKPIIQNSFPFFTD